MEEAEQIKSKLREVAEFLQKKRDGHYQQAESGFNSDFHRAKALGLDDAVAALQSTFHFLDK